MKFFYLILFFVCCAFLCYGPLTLAQKVAPFNSKQLQPTPQNVPPGIPNPHPQVIPNWESGGQTTNQNSAQTTAPKLAVAKTGNFFWLYIIILVLVIMAMVTLIFLYFRK